MLFRAKSRRSGFTLIELAIVLGVTGLLFGGLWRLLSSSNVQMRDQATATQHAQVVAAINAYLQGSDGQSLMAGYSPGSSNILSLPGAGACSVATPPAICAYLPPGFYSGSTNPYGQGYSISIMKDNSSAGTAPKSYSFMVMTTGGDAIADTSGGRISAMIGGDGGFIYSNSPCGTDACGSYGSWAVATTSYFSASAGAGHIASRTYFSPFQQSTNGDWVARRLMPSDSAATPFYNTMITPLLMGAKTLFLGSDTTLHTGGGTLDAQGGTLELSGGKLSASTSLGGVVTLGTAGSLTGAAGTGGVAGPGGSIALNATLGTVSGSTANPPLKVTGDCVKSDYSDNSCNYVAQFDGSVTVRDLLYSAKLFAGTFIYQSSDEWLKKDIVTLTDPLADIEKLRPVSFAYKADGKKSLGVIAQELEKVYPELVTAGPDGMKAVSYEGLIAPLIGAVQELKKENEALRAEVKAQAAKQEALTAQIEKNKKK